jgi:AmiR/NasT family two-component response regulator
MATTKKKKSVQVRLGKEAYDIIRREAFKKHRPMTEILEEMIASQKSPHIKST